MDVLNDGNTRYLPIQKGQVACECNHDVVAELDGSLVVKDNLQMALLIGGSSGSRNLFFATLERRTARVAITMPRALVRGAIHVKLARDAQSFLSIEASNFIPVTDATVQYLNLDDEPSDNVVAFVNRDYISSLAFEG